VHRNDLHMGRVIMGSGGCRCGGIVHLLRWV